MSLSAHERHALHAIEEQLAWSDPKLDSLLGMFTRLTSGEQMPLREKIRAGCRWQFCRDRARRLCRPMRWQRAILLLWLVIALALTATALVLSRGGGRGTCIHSWAVSCAGKASMTTGRHPQALAAVPAVRSR